MKKKERINKRIERVAQCKEMWLLVGHGKSSLSCWSSMDGHTASNESVTFQCRKSLQVLTPPDGIFIDGNFPFHCCLQAVICIAVCKSGQNHHIHNHDYMAGNVHCKLTINPPRFLKRIMPLLPIRFIIKRYDQTMGVSLKEATSELEGFPIAPILANFVEGYKITLGSQ